VGKTGGPVEDRLRIERRDIPVEDLDGLYTERTSPTRLALCTELSREEEESLEVEAEGLVETGRAARWGGREWFFKPRAYENMSRRRLYNLRKIVEQKRPDWVEQVRMATLMDNEVYTIVHLSGVPPYPAVAILENMKARGELKD